MAQTIYERESEQPGNRRPGLTAFMFVILGLVAVLSVLVSAGLGTTSAACAERSCNDGLVTSAGYVSLVGVIVVFVGSAVVAAVRSNQHRSFWWVPLIGVVVTLLVFFIGWFLLAAGLGFSLGDFFGPVQP